MSEDHGFTRLTSGAPLTYAGLRQACYTLRCGGMCILPSDTAYSVAILPFISDARRRLSRILPEKSSDPIPLAFGSLSLVEKYATLGPRELRVIGKYWPGAVTLVCLINNFQDKTLVENSLHTHGTIGVRITASRVEVDISNELQMPITTCAVRDDSGKPVKSFDDAFSIVHERMTASGDNFYLYSVKMLHLPLENETGLMSTVVSVQEPSDPLDPSFGPPYSVHIYRPGLVDRKELEATLQSYSSFDVEEWT